MRSGQNRLWAIAGLAIMIAALPKDLAMPLFMLSMFGLFDRLIAAPVLRARIRA